jgi:hypothetical protein
MCNKKTRIERLQFIGEHFGLVGELPTTMEYMGWCKRNGSPISRMTAVRDIKQAAFELGVSIREQPKHLRELVHTKDISNVSFPLAAEKNIPPREVVVEKVDKKSYTDKDKEILTKEVFARNDKKMGLSWKNTLSNVGKARKEVIDMLEKGVFHLT